jgi:acetylornithine deacetylase/succinyl-diaminopimelate desuccinylase-like protein
MHCLSEQGLEAVLTAGSTDANIPLSRGMPAVVMGISTGGGAHTLNEFVDIEPIAKGVESVARFVELVGNQ